MNRTRRGHFVELLIRHRLISLSIAVLICAAGFYSLMHIPRDSFPDITPIRVEVDTQVNGLAAEEIEKLVSYPIEQALGGIPHCEQVRSTSKFSLSVVEVRFDPGTNLYWARDQVFQQLGNATLPPGVTPQMAPMDEGTGQVYIYTLTSKKLNNEQLRTLQDFVVKPQLRVVRGVADVPIFGGYVRQYEIVLDPRKLTALGLGIADVNAALQANNQSNGGNYLPHGSMQYVIRGLGLIRTLKDIANIVIANPNGVPIRIKDVGTVRFGREDRQGAVSANGQGEVVAGIVIKRLGENTAAVIRRVKARLAQIQEGFSHGETAGMDTRDVKVVTLYDQSYLIDSSTDTVTKSLILGAIIIIVVQALFLGSLRECVLPILATLFCSLLAIALMRQSGISANLLSLGGIALSLGMMVDATVMIMENVHRHVTEESHPGWSHQVKVAEGTAEVLRPTVLAVLVIIAVFLPVLSLEGIEGQLFIPLALTVVFAMIGSLLMAIAIAPSLCYYFIPENKSGKHGQPSLAMRAVRGAYEKPLRFAVDNPWIVILGCLAVLALSAWTFRYTGTEFLPPLEENNIRIRMTSPPSISLKYAMKMAQRIQKQIIKEVPVATRVVSYVGRPELGGDPESISNDEIAISLKPPDQWPTGLTKAKILKTLRKMLGHIPGTTVQFSQELEMRTDEMISGFNTPITVYVLGHNPHKLLDTAQKLRDIIATVPGTADVSVEHVTGIDNLDVIPNRKKMALDGVSINNILDVVSGSVGGAIDGQVFIRDEQFNILARVRTDFRNNAKEISRLLVASSTGARVPLSQVAQVKYDVGFDHIDRYNGQRRIVVMSDIKGSRSVGTIVSNIRAKVKQELKLPGGISLHYGGQAEEAKHAFSSMAFAAPAALLIVFLLIYVCFDNVIDTLIVLSSIPLGIAGGTFLLMFLHLHLNVPALIGFIAKFGIAVQNGMIMVTYMNKLVHDEGLSSKDAAIRASMVRLRPELLSALIGSLGLLPFLLASGTGATVEAPLAAVVIGGVAVSRPMAWFLIPSLYGWLKKTPAPAPDASSEEVTA